MMNEEMFMITENNMHTILKVSANACNTGMTK